ncbi:MAG: hypothetical protein VYA48_09460, partial [Gemmatimonadota bacterium]|nr:hypothetical protein [Gemmatimonadota bacterium]
MIEKSGRPAVAVEADELIPVKAGQVYRLRMNYRMKRNDGDPRGRLNLQAFYYDADGKPITHWACSNNSTIACIADDTCGEGGTCSRRYPVREEISTMYDRKASTLLFTTQTHIAPGTYYDASGGDASRAVPVTKDAAFVRLKFWTNYFFEGEISVEGTSLTPVYNGELGELPEGGLAYDIVANRCDGGDANGQTCLSDADCGEARCGAATPGFAPLPIGGSPGDERACGFPSGNARMNRDEDYPTRLLGQNAKRAQLECRLEPNREYVLSLYMGGYWRNDPRSEVHTVSINGSSRPAIDESGICEGGALEGSYCATDDDCGLGSCQKRDLYEEIYFSRVNETLVDPD